MFIEASAYPFLKPLQENWEIVLNELRALSQTYFVEWPERDIYDGDWRVFALFRLGVPFDRNVLACPETARMLQEIPGLVNAGFSSLASGVYIGPHTGYTKQVLRCHVGLIVPENCGIRVGQEVRGWTPGSCFVFDDTQEHEAWNQGASKRIVLLFDFKRDPDAELTEFPDDLDDYKL
jgi:aspartyl/asparaginyl beta-hydroxylase (cupin superfamily)